MTALSLPAYAQLSDADEAALSDLYRRGTPANTLRAWERDLVFIAAWRMASFCRPLAWPEEEKVALRFILGHAQNLTDKPSPAQDGSDDVTALLCGSSQTHRGTSLPSGGGHIIRALHTLNRHLSPVQQGGKTKMI